MTRTNAQGNAYSPEQELMATLAESLGWVVDDTGIYLIDFSHLYVIKHRSYQCTRKKF